MPPLALLSPYPPMPPLTLPPPSPQVIDVDTSSSVAEIRVSEAVVNRVLLRYVDKKTNEVGAADCLVGWLVPSMLPGWVVP